MRWVFPVRSIPPNALPGSLRIMTTGDAFTSAEGVDTPKAWPRLLEGALARRLGGRLVEVENFASPVTARTNTPRSPRPSSRC